jgi:hypothetical protein
MHRDWNVELGEVEYVYAHIQVVYPIVQCIDFTHSQQVVQVAFQAEVAPVVVEVQVCLCASSITAGSSLCHFGKQGCHLFDFHKSLSNVFLSPPSPCYDQDAELHLSSLLRVRSEVSWFVVAFPVLWCTNTLHCPLWPYSRQGTCRTVLPIPVLPALL